MAQVVVLLRTLLDRLDLDSLDIDQKFRSLRRYPRRRIIIIGCIALFFFYVLFLSGSSKSVVPIKRCLDDQLRPWSQAIQDTEVGLDKSSIPFIGNGHIGVDANGELRVSSNGSHTLNTATKFYPFLSISAVESIGYSNLTDFRSGKVTRIGCFLWSGECVNVISTTFAHRTRPHILFEELKIVNPTVSSVDISLRRDVSPLWADVTKKGDAVVFGRTFANRANTKVSAAIICSNAPGKVVVQPRREETFHFICVSKFTEANGIAGVDNSENLQHLAVEVLQQFHDAQVVGMSVLDKEHTEAWTNLNKISFQISHSKAPSILNSDLINGTRYLLLSHSKAPTLELPLDTQAQKMRFAELKNTRCYAGNSNLLFPSRLWKSRSDSESLQQLADIWMLTLEKWGCADFLKSGAEGVAQAFTLSLTQSSYHDGHLEVGLSPSDLHREMSFSGLAVGSSRNDTVTVHIKIDTENRPFFEVSASTTLYACDGGCLDAPVTLSASRVRIPIKITIPRTSILYVATSRKHLEQLRAAIHVSEVGAAPAHEEDVLALHRDGSSPGSMPTSFWVFLGIILVAFHIFLAKLLWTEWRKGDMTPYNPYLRSRYSYVRSH